MLEKQEFEMFCENQVLREVSARASPACRRDLVSCMMGDEF